MNEISLLNTVVPHNYYLLDSGNDASKWIINTLVTEPFTGITAGDAYGFTGQGLRFVRPLAAGANIYSIARRMVPFPRQMSSMNKNAGFIMGFRIRPDISVVRDSKDNPVTSEFNFRTRFFGQGLNTDAWVEIQCHYESADGGLGTDYVFTRSFQYLLPGMGAAAGVGPALSYYIDETLVYNPVPMPWDEVVIKYLEGQLRWVQINGSRFYLGIAVPEGAVADEVRYVEARCCTDNSFDPSFYDLDQLWITPIHNSLA